MRSRSRSRLFAGHLWKGVAVSALAALPLVAAPVGAAPDTPGTPRSTAEVDAAAAWLADQQEADGGFELADFPGFETPDAIWALAAAGQTEPGWDPAVGLAAVTAVETGGLDALDAMDDQVDAAQTDPSGTVATRAQQAAKVIALVAEPLGLDATDFDPSSDSADPVDLVAAVQAGAGPDSDYAGLTFGGRVFAAWALAALGDEPVPAPLLASLAASQQANGNFSYTGSPDGSDLDPDVTAAVVIALSLAGQPPTSATISRAAVSLGLQQVWDGQWASAFDDGNPNSTAMVMLAASALGGNPDQPCWRDLADVRFNGVPYPSPVRAIERRQQPDGRISSPNDGFGITTFATSQAIQGLVAAEGSNPYAGDLVPCVAVPDSRRLVNAHYVDLIGRLSDEAGAAYWVGRLDSGTAPGQLSKLLTGTTEYGRRVVDSLYREYLGRPATPAERTEGEPIVAAGRRYDVTAAILGSDPYFETTAPVFPAGPPSAESWVDAVYLAVLGRSPDPAGQQWALDQLGAGRTRTQVARSLLGADEALRRLVTDAYHHLLRRDTDAAGRDYWVGLIRRGESPERLVLLIAGSPEYVANTSVG